MLIMFSTPNVQYADQPQGEEEQEGTVDAADALEEELAALKHTSKDSHYRFKSVSSGARGVLFIMCSPEINPHGVVHNMFSDVLQQHKRKARYVCSYTFSIVCKCVHVRLACINTYEYHEI